MEGFFEGMVELFDADLKRKGFDGISLPAGSYELHKINGVRLDINKSLDELGVQDGDTLRWCPGSTGSRSNRSTSPCRRAWPRWASGWAATAGIGCSRR